jgi:hypothetical protein
MKKIAFVFALAAAFLVSPKAPAYAQASQQGCQSSGGRAAGCNALVQVPEPSSFTLLMAGLLTLGGLALVLGRKRMTQN